jgi:hypothetical protein
MPLRGPEPRFGSRRGKRRLARSVQRVQPAGFGLVLVVLALLLLALQTQHMQFVLLLQQAESPRLRAAEAAR